MSDRRRTGSGRVTPGDEISSARPAPIPSFERQARTHPNEARVETERRENETHRDIYERGLQVGLARGRQEGAAAARERCEDEARATALAAGGFAAERLARLVEQFEADFLSLETQLADQAIDLAVMIAGRVLTRQVELDKAAVLPVVQDCLAMLGQQVPNTVVRVNPADYEILNEHLLERSSPWPITVLTDESILPGGCRVETPQSLIDGTLETRWHRSLAAFGVVAPLPSGVES